MEREFPIHHRCHHYSSQTWEPQTIGSDDLERENMWWGFECTNTKAEAEKITNCGNLRWGGKQASLGISSI